MGNTTQKLTCLACNQEEEKEEGNGSSFTCGICLETMSIEKKFKRKNCSHPFCLDCISKHIYYKVHDNNMAQVKCPHLGCTNLLDPQSCQSILTVETFARWCDVIFETMVIESSNIAYCYCPFEDCSELVVDECGRNGMVPKAQCPSCKRVFCFQCKVPWHEGYRCSERVVRKERDEELFEQLAEKKRWKRCPKCNACVEVIAGCAVVTCRCAVFLVFPLIIIMIRASNYHLFFETPLLVHCEILAIITHHTIHNIAIKQSHANAARFYMVLQCAYGHEKRLHLSSLPEGSVVTCGTSYPLS